MSTRFSGYRPRATIASPRLFDDIISEDGSRIDRRSSTQTDRQRRLQSRVLSAARRSRRCRRFPNKLKPAVAAVRCSALSSAPCFVWPATGQNLCVAGGLFYNALLVSALERSGTWENVFVQPVAGNAGAALGAALYAWHNVYRQDGAGVQRRVAARTQLQRRRDQAGFGKLQAAVPISHR